MNLRFILYFKDLNKNTILKSSNGSEFTALKVFSSSLKWLKETAIEELDNQTNEKISNDNIKWVLTVPAIWKQPAKSFMREAAVQVIYLKLCNFVFFVFVFVKSLNYTKGWFDNKRKSRTAIDCVRARSSFDIHSSAKMLPVSTRRGYEKKNARIEHGHVRV